MFCCCDSDNNDNNNDNGDSGNSDCDGDDDDDSYEVTIAVTSFNAVTVKIPSEEKAIIHVSHVIYILQQQYNAVYYLW